MGYSKTESGEEMFTAIEVYSPLLPKMKFCGVTLNLSVAKFDEAFRIIPDKL